MRLCLVIAVLLAGCQRSAPVAPPLPTWDRCRTGEPPVRQKVWGARQGTTALGDAGCEWMTVESDGGARVVRRHKIFGGAFTAPDVRVISEQVDSMRESFEWFDGDGDGHHEFEERGTFDDAGVELRVEQFVDGGWLTISEPDAGHGCAHLEIVPIRPREASVDTAP